MYEFEVFQPEIKKSRIIFGRNLADAYRRANIDDPQDWVMIYQEYVD
jgi:hypothetical protein